MYEKVGEISVDKKEEVAAIKLELLGINLDDLLQEQIFKINVKYKDTLG